MKAVHWGVIAVFLGLARCAHAFGYDALVARARGLAEAPLRTTANPRPLGGRGRWVRIGGPWGGRVLQVRGAGPLQVTPLDQAARTVRCAGLRLVTRDPDPAVVLAVHGPYFYARPAHAARGTEAALLWPAAGAVFTHLWVGADAGSWRVYGLLEGPAATAAVRLIIRGRTRVSMAVRMTVFVRNAHGISGVFPLRSMYWYGRANHVPAQALYPAAHDADGIWVRTAAATIWQPLADPAQPRTLQVAGRGARAFGLLQRDRAFGHYESLRARYQDRPDVWEVLNARIPAFVRLRETPWCGQRNIVAYGYLRPVSRTAVFGARCTLYWGRHASPHRLGRVTTTLMGGDAASGDFKYVIEYGGARLDRLPVSSVQAHVAVWPHTAIEEDRLERNRHTGGFRQIIQVAPATLWLRAWLTAAGRSVSEIWQWCSSSNPVHAASCFKAPYPMQASQTVLGGAWLRGYSTATRPFFPYQAGILAEWASYP